MTKIAIYDTTLRDGQMSLWATGMTTAMMLPVLPDIDRAGFEAVEVIASAFFKKLVRELRDDPWERLRSVAQRMTRTPLRAIRSRHMAAFHITPRSISNLWVQRLAANGVRELRISDPSNTPAHWEQAVRSARAAGLSPIVNLIYSISPKHTDDYYTAKTRAAAKLDVQRLCVKDPGGLLTPERTRTLVRAVLSHADHTGVMRQSRMEKALYACDEITGLVTAVALVRTQPDASEDQIRHFMEGNICRCTGYTAIYEAIERAAQRV